MTSPSLAMVDAIAPAPVATLRASIGRMEEMMDKEIQALIDAPLADPLKIHLPLGKRDPIRRPRPVYEGTTAAEKLTGKQVKERREQAYSDKLCAVLDYYATTQIPIERVAAHTSLSIEKATAAMKRRGRSL